MNRVEIIKQLQIDKQLLNEKFGVERIALFDSYARNTSTENSDIDLFVEFKKPSYSSLVALYTFLEKKFNTKIDIVRKGPHLSQRFLNKIEKELLYV